MALLGGGRTRAAALPINPTWEEEEEGGRVDYATPAMNEWEARADGRGEYGAGAVWTRA